jgi:hypothetical protein
MKTKGRADRGRDCRGRCCISSGRCSAAADESEDICRHWSRYDRHQLFLSSCRTEAFCSWAESVGSFSSGRTGSVLFVERVYTTDKPKSLVSLTELFQCVALNADHVITCP